MTIDREKIAFDQTGRGNGSRECNSRRLPRPRQGKAYNAGLLRLPEDQS